MIISYLNENFGPYEMEFFKGLPAVPGAGSIIKLNDAAFGGGSEGVDFRNIDDDDGAAINVLSILEFLGDDLAASAFTDGDVAFATANIAGHEALHLMGARHHDAHGPLGTGIGAGTTPTDFKPTYVGPVGAPETPFAFMAAYSGGGNFSLAGLYSPNFVSERTVIKLEFARSDAGGFVIAEAGDNNIVADAESFSPVSFVTPYPLRPMIDPGDLPPGEDPPPLPVGIAGVGQVITGSSCRPSSDRCKLSGKLSPSLSTHWLNVAAACCAFPSGGRNASRSSPSGSSICSPVLAVYASAAAQIGTTCVSQ